MAWNYISGTHAEQGFDISGSTRTKAYGGTLTIGSLLIATISIYDSNAGVTLGVSDGSNGGYSLAGTISRTAGAASYVGLWYKRNTVALTPTVSSAPSGSAYQTIALHEFTYPLLTSPLHDSKNSASSGGASSATTGTVVATNGDLTFAAVDHEAAGVTTTVAAPFTQVTNITPSGTVEGHSSAYHLNPSGNESVVFTAVGGTDTFATIIASFFPLVAGLAAQSKVVGYAARNRAASW